MDRVFLAPCTAGAPARTPGMAGSVVATVIVAAPAAARVHTPRRESVAVRGSRKRL
ncbi:MAG TPA: hypothetical protein VKF37_14205 [Chloroflexota bacterium]|nr:hypothetical protein [Chloroflexota bacterium]